MAIWVSPLLFWAFICSAIQLYINRSIIIDFKQQGVIFSKQKIGNWNSRDRNTHDLKLDTE